MWSISGRKLAVPKEDSWCPARSSLRHPLIGPDSMNPRVEFTSWRVWEEAGVTG